MHLGHFTLIKNWLTDSERLQWFICPWFFSLSRGFQIPGPMWTWLIWSHLPLMDLWALTCKTSALLWSTSQGCSRVKVEKFMMRIYPHLGMHPAGNHQLQLSPKLSFIPPVLTFRHENQRAQAVLLKARPRGTKRLANGHIQPSPPVPPLCSGLLQWYHSCSFTKAVWEKAALCDPSLCSTWNPS